MARVVNFGHQAVHRTAVTAKALIKAHYAQGIARNYFIGCSRGGGQALMEAQRYPEDFEGIVAGAPAYNWTPELGAATTHHDPDWNYADYDFATFRDDAKLAGETLNATNPDLSAFRNGGGKLLTFTWWADMALSPLGTIAYYEDILAHDATAVEDARLFLMPGVDHCSGEIGPSWVNFLDELDEWVGTGSTRDEMPAYWIDENRQPTGSRLLCAYPLAARYDGQGTPECVEFQLCKRRLAIFCHVVTATYFWR